MKLSTVFQSSIYLLTTLSAVMLAMAELDNTSATPIPLGTIPLAVLALLAGDRLLRMDGLTSNALGLTAVFYTVYVFFASKDEESRLLAGANLLVFLTWIVLCQKKTVRQYWWLFALGWLQVAFASILTTKGAFGALLFLYVPLAMWTLSVFTLYQGELQFTGSGEFSRTWTSRGLRPGLVAAAGRGLFRQRESLVRHSIQHDPREHWINLRFIVGIVGMALVGMGMSLMFFLFIPRIWPDQASSFTGSHGAAGRAVTGFSDEVRLGDMGAILESNERVLQVKLVDNDTQRPVDVYEYAQRFGLDEPLFRGMVLTTYKSGRWTGPEQAGDHIAFGPEHGMIRQEMELDPIGSRILFGMRPVKAGKTASRYDNITIDPDTAVLKSAENITSTFRYTLFSDRSPGRQARPYQYYDENPAGSGRQFSFREYLQLPTGLEGLTELAVGLTDPSRFPGLKGSALRVRQALALESYLRDSGKFTYTLNSSIIDPNIDPVEDFLFNRKSGHCEYYASALTLMLRSAGIQSRMVSGFKGGDVNASTKAFEVQQRHAHTWVEARVRPGWIILDATPEGRHASVEQMAASAGIMRRAENAFSLYWANYVLALNLNRQRQVFYDPMQKSTANSLTSLKSTLLTPANFSFVNWLKTLVRNPQRWFSWQGGVTAFILLLLGAGCVFAFRPVPGLLRRLLELIRQLRRAGRTQVEFYDRLIALLARMGLHCLPSQTPREFAVTAQEMLAGRPIPINLVALPGVIAERFYRVRFGGTPLAAPEETALLQELDELEACLTTPPGPPRN